MANTRYRDTTRVQDALKLEAIPPAKWKRLVSRTLIGAALVAFGVAGAWRLSFPWYASTALVVLGASTWSGQIVGGAIRSLVPLIRELSSAIRGTK